MLTKWVVEKSLEKQLEQLLKYVFSWKLKNNI